MLKKTLFALFLITGLAFVTTNVAAQCGPNEVFIENLTDCDKEVTVYYGEPCDIVGSVTVIIPAHSFACVPVPVPFIPLRIDVVDLATTNSSSVEHPACGPTQMSMHMACQACNMVQWIHDWHTQILPD